MKDALSQANEHINNILDDEAIVKMIEERDKRDNGVRYTIEEVREKMRKRKKKK